MASSSITSWQIDAETVEIVTDFITVCGDCSCEIKRHKEVKPINPKENQAWIFIGKTDVDAEAPMLWPTDAKTWKRHWCWETLKAAKEERGGRRRDGWMASLTQWTWIWANSGRQCSTERPGMLQSRGLQRVRHGWMNNNNPEKFNISGSGEGIKICVLNNHLKCFWSKWFLWLHPEGYSRL